jgi:hypothetical protein
VEEGVIASVGHVIQLSVAPVFLLSAIAGMLAVMTNRLARIIDRARQVEALLPVSDEADLSALHGDLRTLSRRAKYINFAITLFTLTALLVCAVVATLFVAAFQDLDARLTVAVLFVGAMVAFFFGLLCFLREVYIATRGLRIGPR